MESNVEYKLQARIIGSEQEFFELRRAYWDFSEAQYAKGELELKNGLVEFRIVKRKTEVNEEVVG